MTDNFTELLQAEPLKTNAYCYTVHIDGSWITCCVLCTCCDVAKEIIKKSYPEATIERLCVSEVLYQHNGVVLVDVEATVISVEDEIIQETVVESSLTN